MLPTFEDIMKFYNLVKFQLKEKLNGKYSSLYQISSKVTLQIELLLQKASLPIMSHGRLRAMLKNYHQKCRNILKSYQTPKNNKNYKTKLATFKARSE